MSEHDYDIDPTSAWNQAKKLRSAADEEDHKDMNGDGQGYPINKEPSPLHEDANKLEIEAARAEVARFKYDEHLKSAPPSPDTDA